MIVIKEAVLPKDLRLFVKFPFTLYKDSPYWVPPIIKEELSSLQPRFNPLFRDAKAWFYLAFNKKNKVVGRIAAIVNLIEVEQLGKKKIRFGWFDCIDDTEVAQALFAEVVKKGKEEQLDIVEGPAGFSQMDRAGMLIEGFNRVGNMTTNYNYEYLPVLTEKMGFEKVVDWVEYEVQVPYPLDKKVVKFSEIILKRYRLKKLNISSTTELIKRAEDIFDLMNRSYKVLDTFIPVKPYQVEIYKKKYLKFIHPDFICLIEDENQKLVGFSIIMPSFAKALQKANGKLFPTGFWHIMKAFKKNDRANSFLIGIDPHYQNKGLTAIIFKDVHDTFKERGIKIMETNPEMETNHAVRALWKNFDQQLIRRWRTYGKSLI